MTIRKYGKAPQISLHQTGRSWGCRGFRFRQTDVLPMFCLRMIFLLTIIFGMGVLNSRSVCHGFFQDVDSLKRAEQRRIEVIQKAKQTAVCIFGPGGNGGGSGVVVSADGYVVTNFHVIQSAGTFMKCSMADGVLYDGVIVGIDPTGDVAVVKLLGRENFPFTEIADSDQVNPGDWCFAVGNPFLLATDFQPTVSWGIVSGTHRYQYPSGTILEYTDCIQTDAAINPGNSGGPLFSADGKLIGINGRGSFEKRGRVNVGVGYAISSNQVKLFFDHLKSGRIVDHATVDFTVTTDDAGNVVVSDVLEESQAFRRGVRFEDELLEFAGRKISSVNQFKNVLGIYPKGWRVPVKFRKRSSNDSSLDKNQILEFEIRLSGLHDPTELIELVQGKLKPRGPGAPIPIPPKRPKESQPPAKPGEAQTKEASSAPQIDKSLHERRRGFANYRFNRVNLERVWKTFAQDTNYGDAKSSWRLICKDSSDQPLTLVLADRESGYQSQQLTFVLEKEVDLSRQLQPAGSGGLLVALHLWRTMLLEGPSRFGDSYYVGRLPGLAPNSQLHETFRSSRDGVETQWFFAPETGQLRYLEMYPDPEADPCEIWFDDYQATADGSFPKTIKYRLADGNWSTINLERIEVLESTDGN